MISMVGEGDKDVTRVMSIDKGVLGFRLGPARRVIYGFLGTESRPSPEPASVHKAKPMDDLELMAERAAQKYREKVEEAVNKYKTRWTEAMRK